MRFLSLVILLFLGLTGTTTTFTSGKVHAATPRNQEQLLALADFVPTWAVRLPPGLSAAETDKKLSQLAAEHGCRVVGRVGQLKGYYLLEHDPTHSRRRSLMDIDDSLQNHPDVDWAAFQHPRFHDKRFQTPMDPLYGSQWHLHNNPPGVDLNVLPAWDAGRSGSGVGISIVDDGLDWRHPDFGTARYMPDASHDWNGKDNDPSPSASDDTHGTSCGGLSFAGINDYCGVGVAYSANFSAQRLISGPTTDAMEASALSKAIQQNWIFSASWGPTDDGMRKEGPGPLLQAAFEQSIKEGRNGRGSIYVWAGGNGGTKDNVNYDGYANSIYTIAIASVDANGNHAYYSEEGACLVASSTSSPPGISTTAIHNRCTSTFGGTSAAAPMISGVVALMLEANPNLGWRDVQDIFIRTSTKNNPHDYDWYTNGAGLPVNHKYGFGLVNTAAAVSAAADPNRQLLPANISPQIVIVEALPAIDIPDNNKTGITVTFNLDHSFTVEHVELNLRAVHTRRGDLRIVLIAPSQTQSVLAFKHGDRNANYSGWTFTSVRQWGENSRGTWKLVIADEAPGNVGQFNRAVLTVRGH